MHRLKYVLLLLFCWMTSGVFAQQDSSYELKRAVDGDIVDFTVDNLGNLYLLSADNRLKKTSSSGDSLAVYNDVRFFGKIYSIDATNPLKILLYYRDFSTIVALDRYLAVINTIDLRTTLNIYQARAIALAYDNNIWVYDDLEAKLKRVGDDGSLVDQTNDIRQLVDSVPDPFLISDQSGLVYLCDTIKGIYVFDHYGAYKNRLSLRGYQDFNVIDKYILARDQHYFYKYQMGGVDVQREQIPSGFLPAIKITIMPSSIYVLKHNRLEIYTRR